jgi:hypothetical protein
MADKPSEQGVNLYRRWLNLKLEIGVWKTIESKSRSKRQKEMSKFNEKLPAKSQRQKNVNDGICSKNSKHSKSYHGEKFHDKKLQ